MEHRKLVAEALGTAVLVLIGVGVATLSFGFKLAGGSMSAGVVATALAFGVVLLALAYVLGSAVGLPCQPGGDDGLRRVRTDGSARGRRLLGRAVPRRDPGGAGAVGLVRAPSYTRSAVGLGADGWGHKASMIGIGAGGAFATEVVLTLVFVLVVLVATSRVGSPGFAGLAIGLALTAVHLIGIPLTGTSVNPARSLGPAIILAGTALSQVWLFIIAPLLGAAIAALLYRYLIPTEPAGAPTAIADGEIQRTTATP